MSSVVYTVRGIYANRIPILAINQITSIEEFEFEKPGERNKIDGAITDFLNQNINYKLINGEIASAHHIYGFSSNSSRENIIAYIWSFQREYKASNDLVSYGNCVSQPMVTYLKRDANGKFSIVSVKFPLDGENYKNSISELFPSEYHDSIFNREGEQELILLVDSAITEKNKNLKN